MVRNLSREFATMTDEERRRFALERGGETDELDLHDPRDPSEHAGNQPASPKDEVADADERGGGAARLHDRSHEQHIEKQEERRDR
jgi:hypothetical protein